MRVAATALNASPAVDLRGLRKTFELTFALGPLTLRLPRGGICALIGPNGSGKTTLLSMLMGLDHPDAGSAAVLGYDVCGDEVEVKRRVAYVSPEVTYRSWGTVGGAIDFVSGFYPDWDVPYCKELLARFGLDRRARIDTLSFGSRIKLSALLALSRNAELLLLDEPTIGLDPCARQQMFGELLRFMRQEHRTIVIASHQLAELERFADHAVILQAGQVTAWGAIPDLLERYATLELRVPDGRVTQTLHPALRLISGECERATFLLDRALSPPVLSDLGVEVVSMHALTLEELFVALTKAGARWRLFTESSLADRCYSPA